MTAIARAGTTDVPKDLVFNFSVVFAHDEEAQFDRTSAGILVDDARHLFAYLGVDSKFLIQFAMKRGPRLFAFFNLAARETPISTAWSDDGYAGTPTLFRL